jgi:hypothetical protein
MASDLAKHSLATVVGIHEDRSTVLTAYLSEPVLAEASARFSSESTEVCLEMLNSVDSQVKQGELLPPRGDLGELCAAALLGLTMDQIRKTRGCTDYSTPVPVADFLLAMSRNVRENKTSEEKLHDFCKGWNINFTHVVRFTGEPTAGMLEFLWKRRLALYVQEGLAGLDLLVALKNPTRATGAFSCMRIQIKNYQAKIAAGAVSAIFHKLAPIRCAPFDAANQFSVSLLLCVGEVEKRCQIVDGSESTVTNLLAEEANEPKLKMARTGRKEEASTGCVLQMSTCFDSCNLEKEIKTKLKTIATQDRSLVHLSVGEERFGHLFKAFAYAKDQQAILGN